MARRLATAVALTALAIATPSHAAFPGANGKIAFGTDRDGNEEIYSMSSGRRRADEPHEQPGVGQIPGLVGRWRGDRVQHIIPTGCAAPADLSHERRRHGAGEGQHDRRLGVRRADVVARRDAHRRARQPRRPVRSQFDIVVMNADGTGEDVLTADNSGLDVDPAWSPDGGPDRLRKSSAGEQHGHLCDGRGRLIAGPDHRQPRVGGRSRTGPPMARGSCFVSIGVRRSGIPCMYCIKSINANGTGDVTLESSSSATERLVTGLVPGWIQDRLPAQLPGASTANPRDERRRQRRHADRRQSRAGHRSRLGADRHGLSATEGRYAIARPARSRPGTVLRAGPHARAAARVRLLQLSPRRSHRI